MENPSITPSTAMNNVPIMGAVPQAVMARTPARTPQYRVQSSPSLREQRGSGVTEMVKHLQDEARSHEGKADAYNKVADALISIEVKQEDCEAKQEDLQAKREDLQAKHEVTEEAISSLKATTATLGNRVEDTERIPGQLIDLSNVVDKKLSNLEENCKTRFKGYKTESNKIVLEAIEESEKIDTKVKELGERVKTNDERLGDLENEVTSARTATTEVTEQQSTKTKAYVDARYDEPKAFYEAKLSEERSQMEKLRRAEQAHHESKV